MTTVINLKGRKSKQLNEGEVYIGRRISLGGWQLPNSKWANPFKITSEMTREEVLRQYRQYILSQPELIEQLPTLKGKTLACWCHPEKCHGDILVELVSQVSI